MLINASIFSEYDHINGVSANIMVGQVPPCGTGDSDIMFNEKEFIKLFKKTGLETTKETVKEVQQPFSLDITEKDACTVEVLATNYKVPKKQKNVSFPTLKYTITGNV